MPHPCRLLLLVAFLLAPGCGGATASARTGRVELHVHLDGAVSLESLCRICRARGLELPGIGLPATPGDISRYLGTHPAWRRFDVVNDILGGDPGTLRAAAAAFVASQASAGVVYTEVRYDPVRLATSGLANVSISEEAAVRAVQEGLAAGAEEHGVVAYQILCAMRGKPAERCYSTARLAAAMRSSHIGGVVGLDLAGDEATYPNGPYVSCFRYAKEVLRLNTTVHAGEFPTTTAAAVRQAVLEMLADRVGHGYAAARDPATLELLAARRVHLEACPKSAQSHGPRQLAALSVFRQRGLNFGLNTDDPASYIENTSIADVETIAEVRLGFSTDDVLAAYAAASAAAFGPTPKLAPTAKSVVYA